MGQSEVLKLINDLKFTTYDELCNSSECGECSVTKSLNKLKKHNEIKRFKISRQHIYLSLDFYEELKENEKTN